MKFVTLQTSAFCAILVSETFHATFDQHEHCGKMSVPEILKADCFSYFERLDCRCFFFVRRSF
ncbi:unnamed protein product, partial [Tenebrio molitor]